VNQELKFSLWIESKDGQSVIRFAEPGEKFETSPGFLDNLSAPQAFFVGPKTLTAVTWPNISAIDFFPNAKCIVGWSS
jgi:hypothetical protein